MSAASRSVVYGVGLSLVGVGCQGPQSALAPAGGGAQEIANLFWWMIGGGSVIWAVMIGLTIYSVRTHVDRHEARRIRLLLIGGGTVLSTIVLSVLLVFSLRMLPQLLAPAPPGALNVEVRGTTFCSAGCWRC